MTQYWFRQKRYGYGATPTTWQGWALTLGAAAAMAAVSVGLRVTERNDWGLAALIVFDIAALTTLFAVCRRKTEGGLHWRWGNRKV